MVRRRFQSPQPFKEGQFWWLRVWDTNQAGSRKRQRIKLALASMPVREVTKIAEEKLRPVNQGLALTGSAMNFHEFVTSTYIPTYLPLLSSSTQDSYRGVISRYLAPRFDGLCLRELTRLTIQQYFSGMAGQVSYPTISKVRDVMSSILRAAVDVDYLIKSPMEGLRLPLDKRPRQPKPTITPEQFNNLVQLVPEPYSTMLFVSVWTGLRVSELIGLKWGSIHADSITVAERYCRGDWSVPKTEASAATIGVSPEVIARILRLKSLIVEVRAGRAVRTYQVVKSDGPNDRLSVGERRATDERSKHTQEAHPAGGPKTRLTVRELAVPPNVTCDLVSAGGSGPEIRAGPNAALTHPDDDGDLRSNRAGGTAASVGAAIGVCKRRGGRFTVHYGPMKRDFR